MERVRPEASIGTTLFYRLMYFMLNLVLPDRLRWYCKQPVHKQPTIIREEQLHVTDLGTQLKPIIQNWMANEDLRKCGHCGIVAEAK